MKVIGVIPARLDSKRLPQKLIKNLGDKPLLQWTWESAKKASSLDRLIIACDSPIIEKKAKEFGAEVVLTSVDHSSGTDRIAEAVRNLEVNIVINIQADEPFIHPTVIDSLVQKMIEDKTLKVATAYKQEFDRNLFTNPNIVKVIFNKDNFALYFSRAPIPYPREENSQFMFNKHLGIYAYTKDFLFTFKHLPYSQLEHTEKLEQLRVLEAGYRIKLIETNFDSLGIDTKEDFRKAENFILKLNNENN